MPQRSSRLLITNPDADPTCRLTDLTGNNIVNGQDFDLFDGCVSGSNVPANMNCISSP